MSTIADRVQPWTAKCFATTADAAAAAAAILSDPTAECGQTSGRFSPRSGADPSDPPAYTPDGAG